MQQLNQLLDFGLIISTFGNHSRFFFKKNNIYFTDCTASLLPFFSSDNFLNFLLQPMLLNTPWKLLLCNGYFLLVMYHSKHVDNIWIKCALVVRMLPAKLKFDLGKNIVNKSETAVLHIFKYSPEISLRFFILVWLPIVMECAPVGVCLWGGLAIHSFLRRWPRSRNCSVISCKGEEEVVQYNHALVSVRIHLLS